MIARLAAYPLAPMAPAPAGGAFYMLPTRRAGEGLGYVNIQQTFQVKDISELTQRAAQAALQGTAMGLRKAGYTPSMRGWW